MMNEFVENNLVDNESNVCYFVYIDYVDGDGDKYLNENIEDIGIEMNYDLRSFEEAKKFARNCVKKWDKIGHGVLNEIKVIEAVFDIYGRENDTKVVWNMLRNIK